MKLGKKPAFFDVRMPSLLGHPLSSITAPAKLDRSSVPFSPGLYENDTLGDCTCAGLANAARAQVALAGFDVPITDADVVAFYSASCGYNPADPATDQGGIETSVLAYQFASGFKAAAEQVPFVAPWATIDPADLNTLRNVMVSAGAGYLGVELALADQATPIWDIGTPASAGDATPGSWGGHCLCIWDYAGTADTDLVSLLTWGRFQPATWRWIKSRMTEAHALFWPQTLGPDGRNFAGLDADKLLADNQAWAQKS